MFLLAVFFLPAISSVSAQGKTDCFPVVLGFGFLFKLKVVEIVLRLTTALRLVGKLMRENKSHTLVLMVTVFLEKKNLYCTSSQEWHASAPICKAVSSRASEPDKKTKKVKH